MPGMLVGIRGRNLRALQKWLHGRWSGRSGGSLVGNRGGVTRTILRTDRKSRTYKSLPPKSSRRFLYDSKVEGENATLILLPP